MILSYLGIVSSIVLSFLLQSFSYALMHLIGVAALLFIIECRFVEKRSTYVDLVNRLYKYLKPLSFIATISYLFIASIYRVCYHKSS